MIDAKQIEKSEKSASRKVHGTDFRLFPATISSAAEGRLPRPQ